MKNLFGTDGVRGEANIYLTPELAFKLGRIGSYVLTKNRVAKSNCIIIAQDTRLSGDMLSAAISAGICSLGVDVWNLGVIPTPVVAWIVRKFDALAGVMVSASHNPAKDNGIKFFNHLGNKLDDSLELEIEKLIDNDNNEIPRANGTEVGKIYEKSDIITAYIDYIETIFDEPLNKYKVLLDTSNGANYSFAPSMFDRLEIDYKVIHNSPDGRNINYKCGSTHQKSLKETLLKEKFDIGFSYDGDADRLLAIDELGREVDGDEIMLICSKYSPKLDDNKVVVGTVMSNIGFEKSIKDMDKYFIRAKVGDRYVFEMIEKYDAKLGGEQSGHIILPEYNSTGDGLLSSLVLLEAIHKSGKSLKELKDEIQNEFFPQVLLNIHVNEKNLEKENIKNVIRIVESELGENGRVLVRASGTEPVVRVMVEGKEKEVVAKFANQIADVIRKELTFI
ncbi:MAG: phosphoglucosamine mutase [Candidatus Sericytochromatia bacterium]